MARKPKKPAVAKAPKRGKGRPSAYRDEFADQARKLCKLGATDADLADFFEVTTVTIWRWSSRYEQFCSALKEGKNFADDKVERALYQKAVGFEHDTVKIMQYEGSPVIVPYREKVAPDTTACIFWLKNRRPDDWREKVDIKHGIDPAEASLWRYVTTGQREATP